MTLELLLCVGLMSGTSMDGIDAVLMRTDGLYAAEQVAHRSLHYPRPFHLLLRSAEYAVRKHRGDLQAAEKNFPTLLREYLAESGGIAEELAEYLYQDAKHPIALADIIRHSTSLHATLVKELLAEAHISPNQVDAVGYHGQNLYHNPAEGITTQVGDGQLLADETSIFTINDFRANDVRHGGQGAPFAPLYHQALAIKSNLYPVAVVNCGGVANVTLITGKGENEVIGYDSGPGNVLIDRYVRLHTGNRELMDTDGHYGKQGAVSQEVLVALKERAVGKSYLQKLPPKSLDAKDFTLIPEVDTLSMADACTTLEAFTAQSIVDSLDLVKVPAPKLWILAGGGWHNPVITAKLKESLTVRIGQDVEVKFADAVGWDSTYMEAEIFAYLAVRSLKGWPISVPMTTGISAPLPGGHGYVPGQGTTEQVKELLKANPSVLRGYY
jgi:anhydro-N-acetylmuramic acid kinase